MKNICLTNDTQKCGHYITFLSVRPTLIEKVKILNEYNDTTKRQFPVGTVLEITCQGQIGSGPNNVRIITLFTKKNFFLGAFKSKVMWFQTIGWCIQKKNEASFTRMTQTPVHSDAYLNGNQSSTITYTLTKEDIFTRFLCESGDYSTCGSGTAIQYFNISIGKLL